MYNENMKEKLDLAWRRVCNDYLKKKQFVKPIALIEALDLNLDKWLNDVEIKVNEDKLVPAPIQILNIPKGYGLIRPGSIIDLDDLIVYFYCVSDLLPHIFKEIKWSQKKVDFGYTIDDDNLNSSRWVEDGVSGWKLFGEKSRMYLDSGNYSYMIVTDITGFYENIDITTLISDLKSVGGNSQSVKILSHFLNRWCQVTGRGIPQNNSASDILAKFYFDTIDKFLCNKGIVHVRYVDDIRIFCKSLEEAKKALVTLTSLCRNRGLNLQSAKTKILEIEKARDLVLGVQPIIDQYYTEGKIDLDLDLDLGEYSVVEEYIDEINNKRNPKEHDILGKIYRENFIKPINFDKTLFHFVINKMINFKNFDHVADSIDLLVDYPQETEYILKYLKSLGNEDSKNKKYSDGLNKLKNILISNKLIYDYQCYQIISFFKTEKFFIEDLLAFSRKNAEDFNKPNYLRIICMIFLGVNGNKADISLIENFILNSTNHFEKAETLIAVRNMELGKRNSICRRIQKDHIFIELMIEYMKAK